MATTTIYGTPVWEAAPFMETNPFGVDATHMFGVTLRGKTFAFSGNLRIPELDFCGNFKIAWGFFDNGTYGLGGKTTQTPRPKDWYSFDGTEWTRLADFPGAGRTHPAVSAEGGKVWVGGGFGELCETDADPCEAQEFYYPRDKDPRGYAWNLRDTWIYDVPTDTWERGANLPYPIHHPLHFGMDGGAYILGGHAAAIIYNNVWRHNFLVDGTDSWSEMAPFPGPGRVAATQFDHAGKGYIIGGEMAIKGNNLMDGWPNGAAYGMSTDSSIKEDHRSMPTNEVLEYDPVLNQWNNDLPPVPDSGSRWAGSNFVIDNYIYVFNGVIRKGHYHFGNFTQDWPQQGWRMYLGPEYSFTTPGGYAGQTKTATNTQDLVARASLRGSFP
ncbi:Kelch repeat type 1-containing protein [Seminavis robusta]|uniref:Kelch repeat type 1-containing protein n=1 Tax=Seminavis robusta TaxID=568900 RepID=A0A9N8DC92_9STRA|nr:Kelch repeat type 1-containing protein [Seminavis robusta]|eukprot:Sro74_g040770.1 Kelch repeat type 1-containing protein (384) ;mRNA; f:61138-62457